MRKTAFLFALVITTMVGVQLQASDAMKAIVTSYLEIQNQLATDKVDGVKGAAKNIGAQAARMGGAGQDIAKAATAVEQAADLKAARDAFGPLSDAVIAAAKSEGWKDMGGVKVAYCPMVKRSWLQKEDQIRNPVRRCFDVDVRRVPEEVAAASRAMVHAPRERPGYQQHERPAPAELSGERRDEAHADHRQQEARAGLQCQRSADVGARLTRRPAPRTAQSRPRPRIPTPSPARTATSGGGRTQSRTARHSTPR